MFISSLMVRYNVQAQQVQNYKKSVFDCIIIDLVKVCNKITKIKASKMKRSSLSLPSLIPSKQEKLFDKNQLKITSINLKKRFTNQQSPSQDANENNPSSNNVKRAFIQFPKNLLQDNKPTSATKIEQLKKGFFSFKQINKQYTDQIINTIGKMRSRSTLLNKQIKAEVLFNKKSYEQMNQFCKKKSLLQKQMILQKLKRMEPIQMKKTIKTINKAKKDILKQSKIRLSINYHIFQTNLTKYKPYIDYDSTVFTIKDKGYLLSGRKQCPVIIYNRSQNTWSQLQFDGIKPFGQSCPVLLNQNQIMFFGGIRFYQPGLSLVINYIQVINIIEKTNKIKKFDEKQVHPRAYHAQCIYGEFLIVSGGVDKNYKIQKDFVIYNYIKNYWNQLQISCIPQQLKKGFAKHRMIPLFHKRNKYLIYEQTKIVEYVDYIKQEGVYIFGGQDGNLQLSNKLYVLALGKTQILIKQLKAKGKAPGPRKNFSMIRFNKYLVIHGGRNDELSPFTLNSIHFLDLSCLQWKEITGDCDIYRYGHSLMNFKDSEVIIFGGKNDEGLCKEIYPLIVEQQFV